MKRSHIAGFGAIALMTAIPFVSEMPVLANLRQAGVAIAQNIQRQPQIALSLGAEKKIIRNQQGKQQVAWQTLQGNVTVQPGDVLRYIVTGKNNSDRSVNNLVVTQPIPRQTTYVLNSATVKNNTAKVTYSIDNGKNFVEKPLVRVKLRDGKIVNRPAPAELYTHVRWKFGQAISPKAVVNATYQVRVR